MKWTALLAMAVGGEVPLVGLELDEATPLAAGGWMLVNDAAVVEGGVQIVSGTAGASGALWSRTPLPAGQFTLEFDLVLAGGPLVDEDSTNDGFAIWLVEEDVAQLVANKSRDGSVDALLQDWTLLNYRPDYTGFGAFFATTTRSGALRPSVSVAFNMDGHLVDYDKDIPSEFGLYWNFGPQEDANYSKITCRLEADLNNVVVSVRRGGDEKWRTVASVAGTLNVNGYLGITASNRRADGNSTATSVTLARMRGTTPDAEYAKALVPRSVAVADDFGLPEAGSLSVEQQIEILMRQLIQVNSRQAQIAKTLDGMAAQLQQEHEVHAALQDIRQDISKRRQDRLARGSEQEEKLSAIVQSSVRQATMTTTYLAGGLALSIVISGVVIYRRMREMEKKHFL